MSKTTLDLSTLSDISDGTHTVKVKAKADGYRDSEFSNEVSYTKTSAPPVYTVTFSSSFKINGSGLIDGIYYINEAGERELLPVTSNNYTEYRGQTFMASSIDDLSGSYNYATITIDGIEYYTSDSGTHNLPLTLSTAVNITNIYSVPVSSSEPQ